MSHVVVKPWLQVFHEHSIVLPPWELNYGLYQKELAIPNGTSWWNVFGVAIEVTPRDGKFDLVGTAADEAIMACLT